MITSSLNGCSHGFVALCNRNSDPTVIHGCLHSSRSVPTGTMGKEGQGLKKTLTHHISTKPTHASLKTHNHPNGRLSTVLSTQAVTNMSFALHHFPSKSSALLPNMPFSPKSFISPSCTVTQTCKLEAVFTSLSTLFPMACCEWRTGAPPISIPNLMGWGGQPPLIPCMECLKAAAQLRGPANSSIP